MNPSSIELQNAHKALIDFGSHMILHSRSTRENEKTMRYEFVDKNNNVIGSIDLFLYRAVVAEFYPKKGVSL